MRYVEYNVWSGKIYQVSSVGILPTRSTNHVISIEDPIIEEMSDDKRSLESGFIGIQDKAYVKDGTIHLPKPRKELFEIPLREKNITSDVNIVLYTNNKLMEVTINYKALKSWYNHRMKENFRFVTNEMFTFVITKNGEEIKTVERKSNDFLNDFQTTIDLSDIKDFDDIKISTYKLFQSYSLELKKNKYFDIDAGSNNFSKAKNDPIDSEKYNIIISKTNKKNYISIEFNEIDLSTVYKTLNFYITGKDPNELHEILSIPIEDLWDNDHIIKKMKTDFINKTIWCNNKTLNILINKEIKKI